MTEKYTKRRGPITHGMRGTNTYINWRSMRTRCENKNRPTWKNYGGRNIAVCNRWKKFENFYQDMGECPKGFSLERINNNDGYHKDNCKWIPKGEQAKNRRINISSNQKSKIQQLFHDGQHTAIEIASLTGCSVTTVYNYTNKHRNFKKDNPRGETCHQSKLDNEKIAEIRTSNNSSQTLADKFNVSRQTINNVRAKRTWKHI